MSKENAFIHTERGAERDELQERLMMALQGIKSEAELKAVKREYLEKYPDQQEGVEALFGVREILKLEKEVQAARLKYAGRHVPREIFKREVSQKLEALTEYNFILTHFVGKNGADREFLELLWQAVDKMSLNEAEFKSVRNIRKGILTQVATMKVFEELGLTPELSKPGNDAFDAIDLWSDSGHAVQVKSGYEIEPDILETDEISALNIKMNRDGRTGLYASKYYDDIQDFRLKIDRYREREHKPDLKGYFVVIPSSKIDQTTGAPEPELVETLRAKMGVSERAAA